MTSFTARFSKHTYIILEPEGWRQKDLRMNLSWTTYWYLVKKKKCILHNCHYKYYLHVFFMCIPKYNQLWNFCLDKSQTLAMPTKWTLNKKTSWLTSFSFLVINDMRNLMMKGIIDANKCMSLDHMCLLSSFLKILFKTLTSVK